MPNQNDAQEEVPVVPENMGVEGGEAREVDFFESQMEMRHVMESPWFVLDETEANNRLRNPSTGLFVIKPSTTDPFNAPFTVFTRMDGLLVKHRIYRMPNPDSNDNNSFVFRCQSFSGDRTFPTISALVDFVIDELHFAPATAVSAHPRDLYHPE